MRTLAAPFEADREAARAAEPPIQEHDLDFTMISVEIDDAPVDKVQRCFVTYGERAS